ncbi:hypothetical protein [Micromonospora sp. CPCC 206061]|uniref:hypothetical protein n=1 Tax=Micromonospora sp. CPCC 206061 TaxID=3122410 RepID=UPI002FF22206
MDVQYGFFAFRATYVRDFQPAGCDRGLEHLLHMKKRFVVTAPRSHGYNASYHAGPHGQGRPAPPEPGAQNPPSPGPQPVTSVHGLADGTLLHTTDTRRIYKMVGGAPVWQATCTDGICDTQSRPTTQAVINAGPAVPRNGSSAVDQRGRVYTFVGGAPLHQSHCSGAVHCGTPPRISNWSIDARDHMNEVPADGNLIQGWEAATGATPVAVTVGGARINFANPQEVIDIGQGADWASRVTVVSGYAFNGLGEIPIDGTLIQGAGAGGPTPVAMFVAGARINFANPQEVIDTGYGTNWQSKVRAIPARAFSQMRANVPPDGSLIQGAGAGGPTPVAMMVGGSRINFANPQEVIDVGYGADWAKKVRALPTRAFNLIPADLPVNGTLIQGAGAGGPTPVAAMIGGGRVNFANPQEVIDTGHGTDWGSKVRAIPARAFNLIGTRIGDGMVLRAPDAAAGSGINPNTVFLVAGGARVPIASEQEFLALGYTWAEVALAPARAVLDLPTKIGDHAVLRAPDAAAGSGINPGTVFLVAGGARVPIASEQEFFAIGQGWSHVVLTPARVVVAMPTTIANNTVVRSPDATTASGIDPRTVFLIVGGARLPIGSEQEFAEIGRRWEQVVSTPVRVVAALPTRIADGTLVKSPNNATVWVINGGARSPATSTGTVQVIPTRMLNDIPIA